jgi:hypothetical protein
MADVSTCGQGLADHARLPQTLAELLDRLAENLELHTDTLDPTDEHARAEHDVWMRVAARHRSIATELRAAGDLMESYRDLSMARHDREKLSSPRMAAAFEAFVAAEQTVASLLLESLDRDRAMLRQARQAAGPEA